MSYKGRYSTILDYCVRYLPSRWGIEHLERRFAVLSILIVALIGASVYGAVTRTLIRQALWVVAEEAASDNATLRALFLPALKSGSMTPEAIDRADAALAHEGRQRYLLVKVWRPDGRIVYSNARDLIGTRFAPAENDNLTKALAGHVAAELSDLSKKENQDERAAARSAGFSRLLEAYTPVVDDAGGVVGAVEVYRDGTVLHAQIAALRRVLAQSLGTGLLFLWLGLWHLAHRAGRALRRDLAVRNQLVREREATLLGALGALSEAVDAKDAYTAGHVERVTQLARRMAEAGEVAPELHRAVEYAALLHDIGKLAVPDAILNKPGPLTSEERQVMTKHAATGERILRKVPGLAEAAAIVRHHHERWDGAGYPDGLRGAAIPLGARILAVADAYDAITSDRPYRGARTHAEALREIEREAGRQFDPQSREWLKAVAPPSEPAVRQGPRRPFLDYDPSDLSAVGG